MTTLEQFAEKLEGFSKERVIKLFYDLLTKTKEWKNRFEQAEQERKQLLVEKKEGQSKKDPHMPEKAQEWLNEQMLAELNQEIRKVQEDAEKEKARVLNEKHEELYKLKAEIQKLKAAYSATGVYYATRR